MPLLIWIISSFVIYDSVIYMARDVLKRSGERGREKEKEKEWITKENSNICVWVEYVRIRRRTLKPLVDDGDPIQMKSWNWSSTCAEAIMRENATMVWRDRFLLAFVVIVSNGVARILTSSRHRSHTIQMVFHAMNHWMVACCWAHSSRFRFIGFQSALIILLQCVIGEYWMIWSQLVVADTELNGIIASMDQWMSVIVSISTGVVFSLRHCLRLCHCERLGLSVK